jgi:hypothetical protein
VGEQSISLEIAGTFLFRFHQLTQALAAHVKRRRLGERGELPRVEGVGGLALAGVDWGRSAVFHFGIAPGEELQLSEPGELASPVVEATEILAELVEASRSDVDLIERARELPSRIAVNYINMLELLIRHDVTTTWRTRQSQPEALTRQVATAAKSALEREIPPVIDVLEYEGRLYEANAKRKTFELEREGQPRILGTYSEELRELIREAWDKRVVVKLQVTQRRFERLPEPVEQFELLDILEVLGD